LSINYLLWPAVKQREVARSAVGLPLQTKLQQGKSERAHTNRTSLSNAQTSIIAYRLETHHCLMRTWQARQVLMVCEKKLFGDLTLQMIATVLSSGSLNLLLLISLERFLLRGLTAQYYSAIAGIADTYQPSSSISPPGTDIVSENRLIQQRRGPRVQPPTNNERTLARNCGAKDCLPQGADRAARVAPPSLPCLHQASARRLDWGAAGAVLVIAAQRGVCV